MGVGVYVVDWPLAWVRAPESWTEKWLLMRVGFPAPLTFITEAVYFGFALYGAWVLFYT